VMVRSMTGSSNVCARVLARFGDWCLDADHSMRCLGRDAHAFSFVVSLL
jgi:hypothetical protein